MLKVVGVRFRKAGKVYYFNPNGLELELNQAVVVENSRGIELGYIAETLKEIDESKLEEELMPVVRIATQKDLENYENNKAKEREAIVQAKELVNKYNLEMKLVDAEYALDGSKVIINFTCEDRVDFRDLVKDLASVLKTRIELRQIGIRDQAKIVGTIGNCGKECCCKTYLSDFDKVSIKMAKTQNLSLNPAKISGVCGRLMCCLSYENEYYSEVMARMPKLNSKVQTKDGVGTVVYNDILKEKVTVKFVSDDNVKIENYNVSDIKILDTTNNNNDNTSSNNLNTDSSVELKVETESNLDNTFAQDVKTKNKNIRHKNKSKNKNNEKQKSINK